MIRQEKSIYLFSFSSQYYLDIAKFTLDNKSISFLLIMIKRQHD